MTTPNATDFPCHIDHLRRWHSNKPAELWSTTMTRSSLAGIGVGQLLTAYDAQSTELKEQIQVAIDRGEALSSQSKLLESVRDKRDEAVFAFHEANARLSDLRAELKELKGFNGVLATQRNELRAELQVARGPLQRTPQALRDQITLLELQIRDLRCVASQKPSGLPTDVLKFIHYFAGIGDRDGKKLLLKYDPAVRSGRIQELRRELTTLEA